MKKTTIILALVFSTMTSVIFAQAKHNKPQLTDEQKVELKVVHEKFAPEMKELKGEMRVLMVEQQVLLTSQTIDEKAILSKVEEIGELKAEMQKQKLTARIEMGKIAPEMAMMHSKRGKCGKENQSCERGSKNMKASKHGASEMKPSEGDKDMACCEGPQAKRSDMKQGKANQEMGPAKVSTCKEGKTCDLTAEQQDQMAEIKKSHFWKIQDLENSIALQKAKATSIEEQLKTVDQLSELQVALSKERMIQKIEMMNVLTEEQRMKAISKHGNNGPKGNRPDRG